MQHLRLISSNYIFVFLFYFILFCFILFCFVLFCFVLFYFILFYFVLFYFILFCFVLFYFVLFYFVLFCFVLFYFVLFYFILFYFILFCFILFYFILFCFILFYFILFHLHSILYGPHVNSVAVGYNECLLQDVSRPHVGLANGTNTSSENIVQQTPSFKVRYLNRTEFSTAHVNINQLPELIHLCRRLFVTSPAICMFFLNIHCCSGV